jgi:dTDP-4-dehydrorhamnose 3,5-epimerase
VILETTPIPGAFVIRPEPRADERGFFARLWCRSEFAAHGIDVDMVQASVSYSRTRGTLRGMHYSLPPSKEGKLVRCQRGAVHDVVIDLRPDSGTFKQHFALDLDARSHLALYIPPGLAHGFQTLADDTEVIYMMTDSYRPELAAGVHHADPEFGICWPLPVTCIADRDQAYARFNVAP